MLQFLRNIFKRFLPDRYLNVAFDSGENKKPTIVFLHGIAATSNTWNFLIDDLSTNRYRIIALDLLGFGNSPKPIICNYSVDDHSKYIKRTLNRLKVRKPFIMVGHSMGSIIATHYCSQHKKDVSKLFLLSLPIYIKNAEFKQTFLSEKQTDIFLNIYKYLSQQKDFSIKYSQKIRNILKFHDGMDVTEENWNGFRMSLKNTVIKQDTYSELKNINIPTHIIYGALDNFVIQKSVDKLADLNHISVTKLQAVHHLVDKRFASAVVEQINR